MAEPGRIEGETLAATYAAPFALVVVTAIGVAGPGDSVPSRSAGLADSDRQACHCLSWMVVGPGHRLGDGVSRMSPAAGTTWKDPEGQAEDHRQG